MSGRAECGQPFLFCVWVSVLRLSNRFRTAILGCLSITALVPSLSSEAHAACGPDKIGTARTITLDPAKHSTFVGYEKSLGLRDKEVILTFDDGPLGGNTSSVLTTLKKNCVKATFFYVGKMASSQPALVRRVVREGHTLGHHTWNHNRMLNYSSERAGQLLDKGIATLDTIVYGEATGRAKVPFFRYPYLARNKATDKVVASRGLIAFDANIDSLDWKLKSTDAIHDRIMRRLKQEGKGIVLMHDIQSRTAKMLPRLLQSLKDGGYRIVHIVPKGGAVPQVEPQIDPKTDPVVVASIEPTLRTSTMANKVSSILNAPPPRPTSSRSASEESRERKRSGVVTVSTPVSVAEADTNQLKPQRIAVKIPKKASKPVRVASLQEKAGRAKIVRSKKWKLRSSQWIIN